MIGIKEAAVLHASGLRAQLLFICLMRWASSCQPLCKLPHNVRGKKR